jgi:hypothetical protein
MSRDYARFEIPPKEIGRALACSSDHAQAAMLNSMGLELKMLCRHKVETQHCYMADKLDQNGKELVTSLAEFVKLREENQTS